jgi:uncharacterized protein YndB with AHSA1/START domain
VAERSEATATTTELEVTREIRIDASPETVFPFLIEPEKLMRWMGVEAELDPQPGGIYRVHVSKDWVARGEFVAVEPFVRVAFTWGWENDAVGLPPGASLIEVTLEPDGDATIVRLRHSRLPSDEARASHTDGWEHFLARLEIAAAGGDPGPDPWATGGTQ